MGGSQARAVDVDCLCSINFCVWSPRRQKGRLETEEVNWCQAKSVLGDRMVALLRVVVCVIPNVVRKCRIIVGLYKWNYVVRVQSHK